MTPAGRRALLALAALSLIVAVILAAGGGVRASIGGFRFSARSPMPAIAIGLAALAGWAAAAWRTRDTAGDLAGLWTSVDRRAAWIVAAIAAASGAAAVVFNTFAAAAADASGYLSQAALFSSGRLLLPDALSQAPSWPAGPWGTTPLGWRPALAAGFQSPTYPPGLPLLMALPYAWAGTLGAALVVPVTAALSVLAAGALARRWAGGAAGMLAALATAVSPAFVFQSLQPMSDVPVTAAWMIGWWLLAGDRPLAGGIAAAAAIVIRPNLALVAAVPAFAIWRRRGTRGLVSFLIPVAVAGAAIGALQWHWYGSPLSSGYGAASEIFSLTNIPPNAAAYAGWLLETQPVLFLAPLALVVAGTRRDVTIAIAFIAAIAASYLVYFVFENWTYLRFMLPAMAMAGVLVGTIGARAIGLLPMHARAPALLIVALALAAQGLLAVRSRDVAGAAEFQRRLMLAGPYLAAALPPGAVVAAGEQSGAVRHYTGHGVLRWEAIDAPGLAGVLSRLEADRREVWWVLDQWEEPLVRAKFASIAAAALDWPPVMEAGPARTTRAFRVADRARFQRGETIATERLR